MLDLYNIRQFQVNICQNKHLWNKGKPDVVAHTQDPNT